LTSRPFSAIFCPHFPDKLTGKPREYLHGDKAEEAEMEGNTGYPSADERGYPA
jgi:hypothetical protein